MSFFHSIVRLVEYISLCHAVTMTIKCLSSLPLHTRAPLATTVPGQPNSTSTKTPAQPAQQAAAPVQAGVPPLATTSSPTSATPQGQLPPQTQAHMPIQSPTSLQVKTQGGTAQLQLQQTPQLISMSGLQQQVQVRSANTHSGWSWELNREPQSSPPNTCSSNDGFR